MNKLVNNNESVFNYSICKLIFDLFFHAKTETNELFDAANVRCFSWNFLGDVIPPLFIYFDEIIVATNQMTRTRNYCTHSLKIVFWCRDSLQFGCLCLFFLSKFMVYRKIAYNIQWGAQSKYRKCSLCGMRDLIFHIAVLSSADENHYVLQFG